MSYGIIKPPVGAQLNRDHPLSKGLVGCWLFNEGKGLRVNDYSGTNRHGVLSGNPLPKWVSGKYGPSLRFPASGTSLVTATANFGLPYSVCLSFRNNGIGVPYNTYFSIGTPSVHVISLQGHNVYLYWNSNTGQQAAYVIGAAPGRYSMVIESSGVCELNGKFFNGALNPLSPDGLLYVGNAYNGTLPGDADIDYVMVWGRALIDSEMKSLYNLPFQMFEPTGIIEPKDLYKLPTKGKLFL